jgi:hypothetical protein
MTTIKATVTGRRLELDVPADWPDGTEVVIHPVQRGASQDAEAMSPEEIARTLAAMDRVEPFDMSDAEQAAWEAERVARMLRNCGARGNDAVLARQRHRQRLHQPPPRRKPCSFIATPQRSGAASSLHEGVIANLPLFPRWRDHELTNGVKDDSKLLVVLLL